MKKVFLILMLSVTTIAFTQEKTFESEVSKISKKIDLITKEEKDSLKIKVKEITQSLEKGEITATTAETLKKEVAQYHARKIEERVSEQQLKLQQLIQDKTDGKIASTEEKDEDANTFSIGNRTFRFTLNNEKHEERREKRSKKRQEKWRKKNKTNRSTTTQFVFALGVNNVLVDHEFSSLNTSEYKFWESHFYEVGWTWKTRFDKQPSKLYLKYGVSFLWNNLRLTDNRIHVKNGDITELQTFSEGLSESRLRHVQMNFPVHVEWDFSKNKTYEDGFVKDRTHKSIRIGLGGFVGFKLGTRQYLEYRNMEGVKVEELQKENFNMNTINYGLSAYLAHKSIGVYAKYDLNPLFRSTDTRNISLGIRFDFN